MPGVDGRLRDPGLRSPQLHAARPSGGHMSSSSITTAEPAQVQPAPSNHPATRLAAVAAAVFAVSFGRPVAVITVPHGASDPRLVRWGPQGVNVASSLWSLGFAVGPALAFA